MYGLMFNARSSQTAFLGSHLLTSVVLSVAAFGRGSTRQIKDFRTTGYAAPTLLPERALARIQWGW